MKIPLYFFKPLEEIGRAVAIAVGGYIVGAIVAGTLEPTRESVGAALPGIIAVAWGAVRAALNSTKLTPDLPPAGGTPDVQQPTG